MLIFIESIKRGRKKMEMERSLPFFSPFSSELGVRGCHFPGTWKFQDSQLSPRTDLKLDSQNKSILNCDRSIHHHQNPQGTLTFFIPFWIFYIHTFNTNFLKRHDDINKEGKFCIFPNIANISF